MSDLLESLALNARAARARAYVRVVAALRELDWFVSDALLPNLGMCAFVLLYRALGAPREFEALAVIGGVVWWQRKRRPYLAMGMSWFVLTGRVPFAAETPLAVILKHLHDPLPLPSSIKPGLSPAIERVLLKALTKNPEDRYASISEFHEAWKRALTETAALQAEKAPPRAAQPRPAQVTVTAPPQPPRVTATAPPSGQRAVDARPWWRSFPHLRRSTSLRNS